MIGVCGVSNFADCFKFCFAVFRLSIERHKMLNLEAARQGLQGKARSLDYSPERNDSGRSRRGLAPESPLVRPNYSFASRE